MNTPRKAHPTPNAKEPNVGPNSYPQVSTKSLGVEEHRHQFAWKQLRNLQRETLERVASEVQGLPVAIRTQGLVVVIATLIQRGSEERTAGPWLASKLAEWLIKESRHGTLWSKEPESRPPTGYTLLELIMKSDSTLSLAAAQREAIAMATALKRIANVLQAGEFR